MSLIVVAFIVGDITIAMSIPVISLVITALLTLSTMICFLLLTCGYCPVITSLLLLLMFVMLVTRMRLVITTSVSIANTTVLIPIAMRNVIIVYSCE